MLQPALCAALWKPAQRDPSLRPCISFQMLESTVKHPKHLQARAHGECFLTGAWFSIKRPKKSWCGCLRSALRVRGRLLPCGSERDGSDRFAICCESKESAHAPCSVCSHLSYSTRRATRPTPERTSSCLCLAFCWAPPRSGRREPGAVRCFDTCRRGVARDSVRAEHGSRHPSLAFPTRELRR